MTFNSVLFKQKCVTYITSCCICYIRELHPIKSLFILFINSFDKLQMHILDNITMTLKGNLLAISKLRTVCVYHRNVKNNKLRSMMTLNTMYYKVNTFFNENEKVILICKLSNTII